MKIPMVEFDVRDVARINRTTHTNASHAIVNWFKEGLIKMASNKTWRRA